MKRFKHFYNNDITVQHIINMVKANTFRHTMKFKYGYTVPNTHEEAVYLDNQNNNTLWKDAATLEIKILQQYKVFQDLGKGSTAPYGYKKTRCHMIYDVKHDGRHHGSLLLPQLKVFIQVYCL
jgi:hypothetical protein